MQLVIDGKQFNTEGHTGITVSTPTLEFEEVPIIDRTGHEGYICGAHKWLPLELSLNDTTDKVQQIRLRNITEFLRSHSPCDIEIHTTTSKWKLDGCWLMIPYNRHQPICEKIHFHHALLESIA